MKDNRKYFVYTLSSPSDDTPMYIGVTINPKQRLIDHISKRNIYDTAKCLWIRGLVENGERPVMNIVAECDTSREARCMETGMISGMKYHLTNKIEGSSGIKTKRRQSARDGFKQKVNFMLQRGVEIDELLNCFDGEVDELDDYLNDLASQGYRIKEVTESGEIVGDWIELFDSMRLQMFQDEEIDSYPNILSNDLITQAKAAKIMARLSGNKPLVQTIRNAIANGRLNGYHNPEPTDRQTKQRHGLTLVSRSQVEWLWGRDE